MKYKCLFKEGYDIKQQKDLTDIGEVIEATQLWVRFEKVELGNGGPRRFIMSAGNFSVEVTIEEADLSLSTTLVKLVNDNKFTNVVLPRVGCGLGQLNWSQVKIVLETYLDDRFSVITPK